MRGARSGLRGDWMVETISSRKPAACSLNVVQVSASDRSGYMRGARSGLRGDWMAPYGMASDTLKTSCSWQEKVETTSSDVVEYGLASEPICGLSQVPPGRLCHRYAQAGRLRIESGSSECE